MDTLPPHGHGAPAFAPIPAQAGIGLRLPHHSRVLARSPAAAWFEVHPENYMTGAVHTAELETIRQDHPLSLHAVGLSLGSADGVDADHLERLAGLIDRFEPGLVSDHLSWSAAGGVHLPDLLPLPYTEEALAVVARNLDRVQSALKRPLLVENPSTYLRFAASTLAEPEFLAELARRSGCGVLLDVNNVYVSARNHGTDPSADLAAYLAAIPPESIGEIHLAGHAVRRLESGAELRIDDHGSRTCEDVWALYEATITALGPRPTLIEWDTAIPAFETLQDEARIAQEILDAQSRPECHPEARRAVAG